MAQPTRSQEDFNAWKSGVLRDFFNHKKTSEGRKKMFEILNAEISISDKELKEYIDDIFREDIRSMAYRTFLRAKESKRAIKSYYQFINAYQLYKNGEDSYGNICCLTLDSAEELLRKENTIGKNRK